MIKKYFDINYYEEHLYCECGNCLNHNEQYVKTETLYKTTYILPNFKHQDIIGKKFICLKCGKDHIEDKYNIYPIKHKILIPRK